MPPVGKSSNKLKDCHDNCRNNKKYQSRRKCCETGRNGFVNKNEDLPPESLKEGFNIANIDKIAKSVEQSFYFAPRNKAEYDFEANK